MAAVPSERVILFLENKGEAAVRDGRDPDGVFAGNGFYQVPSFEAYLRDIQGQVVSPIQPGVETNPTEAWLQQLNGQDFDSIIDQIRAVV
jgi:hypothetical protein